MEWGPDDEVEAVHNGDSQRVRVNAPAVEDERREDEEERCDVDDVPLFDPSLELRREIRGLHPGVETESDYRSDRGAAHHAQLSRPLLAARREEPGETEDEGHDADPDRERSDGPVSKHEDAVLPVLRHFVPGLAHVGCDRTHEDERPGEKHEEAEPVTVRPGRSTGAAPRARPDRK